MGFSTEVTCSIRVRANCIPLEHRELCIAALNHEPVTRAVGNSSTDFTSEFLKSRHSIAPFSYASISLDFRLRDVRLKFSPLWSLAHLLG